MVFNMSSLIRVGSYMVFCVMFWNHVFGGNINIFMNFVIHML
jgi:hypothetical protein